jgi:hypothetical protein
VESPTAVLVQDILQSASLLCKQILGDISMDEYYCATKHGSGVTVGSSYEDCSMEAKFTYPISGTKSAIERFEAYIQFDESLSEAISSLNGQVIPPNQGHMYAEVEGSVATTVDKTATSRRMIAKEPTVNMFLQQGLMAVMYERLSSFGLDVKSLPLKHKLLAKVGSLDNSLATIDFSSASDCVSRELLRWILPSKWFDLLDEVRSDTMEIPGRGSVYLEMFSTMGNATTFPLETLLLYCLASASHYHCIKHSPRDKFVSYEAYSQVSVFGDDCILPTKSAPLFMEVAEQVGFFVNKEKSFYGKEHFRESCGGDYYHGFDVRPFCFKAPHNNAMSSLEPWLYIIMNNLLPIYKRYFGDCSYIYQSQLFETMVELFRQYQLLIKVVPDDYPEDAGLKISNDLDRFMVNYSPPMSRISVNEHGTRQFLYCKFRYKLRNRWFDRLRLTCLLKYWFNRQTEIRWCYNADGTVRDPDEPSPIHSYDAEGEYVCEHVYNSLVSSNQALSRALSAVFGGNEPLLHSLDLDSRDDGHYKPIRRIGGYVVAKGESFRF